jgi:hypothetical protein
MTPDMCSLHGNVWTKTNNVLGAAMCQNRVNHVFYFNKYMTSCSGQKTEAKDKEINKTE